MFWEAQSLANPNESEDIPLSSSKAWMGIEPMIFGLRDQRLTTWPPRRCTIFPLPAARSDALENVAAELIDECVINQEVYFL